MELKGRVIARGVANGIALVSSDPISFLGGVDPLTGKIIERGHAIEGETVSGKILVFPRGKGSTVGSYVLYRMKKAGTAPAGILNSETETIVAIGAIIAAIPLVDKLNMDPILAIKTGQHVIMQNEVILVE
ncbi:MAG: aconitase subunit 2 [Promethearchaeota archaeon CR_4]|nr:MAG: aconitase subunit 2 [Candidatus Lokiarchaeota archaeon CR_4]